MTGFLASVSSVEEATLALSGGADIIDLKNPRSGALGALAHDLIRQTVATVASRVPTSATIGDLEPSPALVAEAVRNMKTTGVDFIKIGFFADCNQAHRLIDGLALEAQSHRLVAVLFADSAYDLTLLPKLAEAGFHGVMLDTATKNGAGLCHSLPTAELMRFVETAAQHRLLSGLAGQLTLADIPTLLPLRPDYLGFRSALCRSGDRGQQIDELAIKRVRSAICRVNRSVNTDSIKPAVQN